MNKLVLSIFLFSLLLPYMGYSAEFSDTSIVSTEQGYCSEVMSSIKNAKIYMESSFADIQKYPKQIPSSFKPDGNTIVELVSVDDQKYSMKAYHPKCSKIMLTTSDKTEIIEQAK